MQHAHVSSYMSQNGQLVYLDLVSMRQSQVFATFAFGPTYLRCYKGVRAESLIKQRKSALQHMVHVAICH